MRIQAARNNQWVTYLVILAAFASLGTGRAAASDVPVNQPGWKAFHAELEKAVAREAEEAKREAENRETPAAGERPPLKPDAFGHSPENLVDESTYQWLSRALKRPIPDESTLRSIFRAERVPEELIYAGLVESGYHNNAVSHAGAVGPWQFMEATGLRYGLGQGKKGDERRDLIKSTRAAARYLRDLFDLLGDWKLALAGYNSGENRVLQAMKKARTNDFWALRYLLPPETAEYVPRVLAAISIAGKMRPTVGDN